MTNIKSVLKIFFLLGLVLAAAGGKERRELLVERTRANPSVETAEEAGTASEGSANLIVIATSGPMGPIWTWGQRDYLKGRCARVARVAYRALVRAARQPRESQGAAGHSFCRVPAGFQQAINGQICDGGTLFEKIYNKNNGLSASGPEPQ